MSRSYLQKMVFSSLVVEDSGVYECEERKIQLTVREVLPPSTLHTDFTNSSKQVEVLKRVELSCEASGQPEPTTTWFKNNEVLEEKEDNPNLMLNTSMLIIRSMLLADLGNYTCMKTNRGGSLVSHVQLLLL